MDFTDADTTTMFDDVLEESAVDVGCSIKTRRRKNHHWRKLAKPKKNFKVMPSDTGKAVHSEDDLLQANEIAADLADDIDKVPLANTDENENNSVDRKTFGLYYYVTRILNGWSKGQAADIAAESVGKFLPPVCVVLYFFCCFVIFLPRPFAHADACAFQVFLLALFDVGMLNTLLTVSFAPEDRENRLDYCGW